MAATGTSIIDFGAFPGASDASLVVTGQTGILTSSVVEVWINPVASVDHTADEHLVETLGVGYITIVANTGFTLRAFNINQNGQPDGKGTRLYGKWNLWWAWF